VTKNKLHKRAMSIFLNFPFLFGPGKYSSHAQVWGKKRGRGMRGKEREETHTHTQTQRKRERQRETERTASESVE
jgi:hypothetical protein